MPKLYVIEKPEELIGKTIGYIEMNRFHNPLMLMTTDGGLMVWETYMGDFDGDIETEIYEAYRVEAHLFGKIDRTGLELVKRGICSQEDVNAFFAKQIEQRRKESEKYKKDHEKHEAEEYERLKAKFESNDSKEG